MASVRTVVGFGVAPRAAVALDRALCAEAARSGLPLLRLVTADREALLLGRFHADLPAEQAAPVWCRRLSGGRVWPVGPDLLGIGLALPHRSALVSSEPCALRAEQTMNRAVRGLLGALAGLGIDAVYPGRDLVTAGGKPIAWISLGSEDGTATLVEMGLAVGADLAILPVLADRADPGGVVPVTMWMPGDVTSLARERRRLAMPEVVAAVVAGFRDRLGLEPVIEQPAAAPADPPDGLAWDVPAQRGRCGRRRTMLGSLAAHVAVAEGGRLAGVRLCGDLIASRPTVLALEEALGDAPPRREALLAAMAPVLADPEHYLLGATTDDVAAAVLDGAAG